MRYFEYLDDIPKVPDELVEIILTTQFENISHFKDPQYKIYLCPPLVQEWIRDNVRFNVTKMCIHEMNQDFPPHIDARDVAVNYLLRTGGGILSHYTSPLQYVEEYLPIEKLNEVNRVDIEPFRWHMLDASKLHGVSNISSQRLAITLNVA